jgi:hypothetical protein
MDFPQLGSKKVLNYLPHILHNAHSSFSAKRLLPMEGLSHTFGC